MFSRLCQQIFFKLDGEIDLELEGSFPASLNFANPFALGCIDELNATARIFYQHFRKNGELKKITLLEKTLQTNTTPTYVNNPKPQQLSLTVCLQQSCLLVNMLIDCTRAAFNTALKQALEAICQKGCIDDSRKLPSSILFEKRMSTQNSLKSTIHFASRDRLPPSQTNNTHYTSCHGDTSDENKGWKNSISCTPSSSVRSPKTIVASQHQSPYLNSKAGSRDDKPLILRPRVFIDETEKYRNVAEEFVALFSRQMKRYYQLTGLDDLIPIAPKTHDSLQAKNYKECWMDRKGVYLTSYLKRFRNAHISISYEEYESLYKNYQSRRSALRKRFPSRYAPKRRGKSIKETNLQTSCQTQTTTSTQEEIKQTVLLQKQEPASQPVCYRFRDQNTQKSTTQQLIQMSATTPVRISKQTKLRKVERVEYKMNKFPLQLNEGISDGMSLGTNLREPPSSYVGRLADLLKKNMVRYPNYIQVLKDIINI